MFYANKFSKDSMSGQDLLPRSGIGRDPGEQSIVVIADFEIIIELKSPRCKHLEPRYVDF